MTPLKRVQEQQLSSAGPLQQVAPSRRIGYDASRKERHCPCLGLEST